MAGVPATRLTEEQYLEIERAAFEKSEFYGGQMFAMAGGSPNHSFLAGSMTAILYRAVRRGCRVFTSDLRIKVPAVGLYTYPDCGIVCGKPIFADGQPDCLLNPLLLAEVLSPSTENYDRGKKFEFYRKIESLREYLIVHQERRHVEHYSKQEDGSWLLREFSGPDDVIPMARLSAQISLAELYEPMLE